LANKLRNVEGAPHRHACVLRHGRRRDQAKKPRRVEDAAIFLALWFYVKLKFVPTGHATSIFFRNLV
jgi:hypothetical protein